MRWRVELLCLKLDELRKDALRTPMSDRKYDFDRDAIFDASGWTPTEFNKELRNNPKLQMMKIELCLEK